MMCLFNAIISMHNFGTNFYLVLMACSFRHLLIRFLIIIFNSKSISKCGAVHFKTRINSC